MAKGTALAKRRAAFRRIKELMGDIPANPNGAAVIVNKALIHASACPQHPRYQAKRAPTRCASCKLIWNLAHGESNSVAEIHGAL